MPDWMGADGGFSANQRLEKDQAQPLDEFVEVIEPPGLFFVEVEDQSRLFIADASARGVIEIPVQQGLRRLVPEGAVGR